MARGEEGKESEDGHIAIAESGYFEEFDSMSASKPLPMFNVTVFKGTCSTLSQALSSIVHQVNKVLWTVGECLHLISNISLSTSLLQTHRPS